MINSFRSRIAFAVILVIAASAALIVAISYSGNNSCCNSSNGIESSKRIIAFSYVYDNAHNNATLVFKYVRTQDTLSPNGAIHFLSPFGNSMSIFFQNSASGASGKDDQNAALTQRQKEAVLKDADEYEQYILIRLPNGLISSGQNDSITAYRAYSDLDPESKCLLAYRNDPCTGAILEDICHNDVFRVSDGYSCFGHIAGGTNPVVSGYNAVPRMRISADDQGYVLAIKPDGMPSGDGIVGDGRIVSTNAIKSAEPTDSTCNQYSRFLR